VNQRKRVSMDCETERPEVRPLGWASVPDDA
jgi:hypothetical protein